MQSSLGSGKVPENMSAEQRASFENGLIAGEIIKGAGITVMAGGAIVPTLVATGAWEMAQGISNQKPFSTSVNNSLHAMGSSMFPVPIDAKMIKPFVKHIPEEARKTVQILLETGNEATMQTVYEFYQLYLKNPEEATGGNFMKILENNGTKAIIGKAIEKRTASPN